jgi:hypothetical protein
MHTLFNTTTRFIPALVPVALLAMTFSGATFASDKMEALERERQEHNQQIPLFAKNPPKEPMAIEKQPPAPPILIENGHAPFRAQQYKFTNQIQVTTGGKTSHLYAGVSGRDPSQGVIVVLQLSDDRAHVTGPFEIKGPAGAGPLKFSEIKYGHTAVIATQDGKIVSAPIGQLIAGVSPF